jgi:hypothetical protein
MEEEELDLLGLKLAGKKKSFELEERLLQSKWFDYRFLHPMEATLLFYEEYKKIHSEYVGRVFDIDSAEYRCGIKGKSFGGSPLRDQKCLHKARQAADEIGCTYSFLLRTAFGLNTDCGNKYLPRPCHLYSVEQLELTAILWKEHCLKVLQIPKSKRFRDDMLSDISFAMQTWLLAQIASRSRPELSLSEVVFNDPIIQFDLAERAFGPQKLMEAKSFAFQ